MARAAPRALLAAFRFFPERIAVPASPSFRLRTLFAFLLLTCLLFASLRPAAAQAFVKRQLNLPAQKLGNVTVSLVSVTYGDMSSPKAGESSMSFVVKVKNISAVPQAVKRGVGARLHGMRQFTTDTFYSQEWDVLPPGAERLIFGSRRFSYIQHRTLKSVEIREFETRADDERYSGPLLGSAEFEIPPLDPKWVDPDMVQINGPSLPLKHWSARVVAMRYPQFAGIRDFGIQPVILIALKNLTGAPMSPEGYIDWALFGSDGKRHFLGTFGFNVRDEAMVPPGGEILIYVGNRTLNEQEYAALNAVMLTEHSPIGHIAERTIIAKVMLPLPPRPPGR